MSETRQKKECKYRVKYYLPQLYQGWLVAKNEEIDLVTFDVKIPERAIGYEVQYGTFSKTYKSYSVYQGNVISFEEAINNFPNGKLCARITERMLLNDRKKEELIEIFSKKVDLQQKFMEFVEECEKVEITEDTLQEVKSQILGIVVMAKNEHLVYVYSDDVVISE